MKVCICLFLEGDGIVAFQFAELKIKEANPGMSAGLS